MHFETQGVNGRTKGTTNANPVNDTKQKYRLTERDNILKPKDNDHMSGWMTVWRLDTGELKDGKTQQDGKATVQLGGDITKESKKCKSSMLKEAYEEP